MKFIRGPDQANHISDPDLRDFVARRFREIVDGDTYDPDIHGDFIVVEPGDTAAAVEEASGWPILTNPLDGSHFGDPEFVPVVEWVAQYPRLYLLAGITNDEGAGFLLFVPKAGGIDPSLLALCRQFAEPVLVR